MRRIEDIDRISPGARVRVTRRIVAGDKAAYSQAAVEGTVLSCRPDRTGSWFAHGKNDRVWLMRLRVRKDDGEESDLIVDRGTRVEVLS